MSAKTSGIALRDSFLAKLAAAPAANREAEQIEVLAGAKNRELLVVLSQFKPRSISELAAVVQRHQPNVSRSLSALVRADLVELIHDGRASVPTLTATGARKAGELRGEFDVSKLTTPETSEDSIKRVLSVAITSRPGDLQGDEALGTLTFFSRYRSAEDLDLNEVSMRLLKNWWRVFYRLDDPFRLCVVKETASEHGDAGALLIKALGTQVEMYVRAALEDEEGADDGGSGSTRFTQSSSQTLLFEGLIAPVAAYLEMGRRLNRPLHSLLRRLEDVRAHDSEHLFAKTAGALGLSPHGLPDEYASVVRDLTSAIPEESARLEFASATVPEGAATSLAWLHKELYAHRRSNRFEGLGDYVPAQKITGQPAWRIGKTYAERLRERLRLASDQPVGGVGGLIAHFGGKSFQTSDPNDEVLLGYRRGEDKPVIVVKEAGPAGTAFHLGRAIGDFLAFEGSEAPVSELKTDRQRLGRAFSAELLAPSDGVIRMIEEEGRTMLSVARHYGVDLPVVRYQYTNHA